MNAVAKPQEIHPQPLNEGRITLAKFSAVVEIAQDAACEIDWLKNAKHLPAYERERLKALVDRIYSTVEVVIL